MLTGWFGCLARTSPAPAGSCPAQSQHGGSATSPAGLSQPCCPSCPWLPSFRLSLRGRRVPSCSRASCPRGKRPAAWIWIRSQAQGVTKPSEIPQVRLEGDLQSQKALPSRGFAGPVRPSGTGGSGFAERAFLGAFPTLSLVPHAQPRNPGVQAVCHICNKAFIYPHHQLSVQVKWVLSKANKSQGGSWEIPFPKTSAEKQSERLLPRGLSAVHLSRLWSLHRKFPPAAVGSWEGPSGAVQPVLGAGLLPCAGPTPPREDALGLVALSSPRHSPLLSPGPIPFCSSTWGLFFSSLGVPLQLAFFP